LRDCTLGVLECFKFFSVEQSLEMYRRARLCAHFEEYLQKLMSKRDMGMPIYLSLGQEYIASALSMLLTGVPIFAQHRGHSVYLAFGGDIEKLIDELLMKDSGCCGGMGGSASIHDQNIKMYGHSGLLGDQIPIAVGMALGTNKPVLCIAGDAAIEEDYALSSIGFAGSKHLPVLFVCEDNNLSILTEIKDRRTWDITKVSESFGVPAVDIADDPWTIMTYVENSLNNLPFFINIRVCRKLWHAGSGTDGSPEWDRNELVNNVFSKYGLQLEREKIDYEMKEYVEIIWDKHLQKL
jgi:acetoin:2,6-dichlorophenolindophenol oxidoreductase subunit alpha